MKSHFSRNIFESTKVWSFFDSGQFGQTGFKAFLCRFLSHSWLLTNRMNVVFHYRRACVTKNINIYFLERISFHHFPVTRTAATERRRVLFLSRSGVVRRLFLLVVSCHHFLRMLVAHIETSRKIPIYRLFRPFLSPQTQRCVCGRRSCRNVVAGVS